MKKKGFKKALHLTVAMVFLLAQVFAFNAAILGSSIIGPVTNWNNDPSVGEVMSWLSTNDYSIPCDELMSAKYNSGSPGGLTGGNGGVYTEGSFSVNITFSDGKGNNEYLSVSFSNASKPVYFVFVKYGGGGHLYYYPDGVTSGGALTVPGQQAISHVSFFYCIPQTTSLNVTKVWNDANDQDGIRPVSVSIQLLKNGQNHLDPVVLNAGNTWSGGWTNLQLSEGGQLINYSVIESPVPDGYEAGYQYANGLFTVTNTYTPETIDLDVEKIWADNDDQDGARPESVSIQLKKGSSNYGEPLTLDEDNFWTDGWTGLPKYDNGQLITYSVIESPVPSGYTASYDYDDGLFTVTNTYTPDTISLYVDKIWADNDDQDGIRPDSVSIQLMKNDANYGDPLTLDEDNDWTDGWAGLPKYDDGQLITYSVVETPVPTRYTASYDFDDGVFTVTNTYIPHTVGGSVTKVWNDNNNQDGIRPASVTVQLLKNGENYLDPVVLNAGNNWTASITNLPAYENGQLITYTVVETPVPTGYTVEYDCDEGDFTVTNTHIPQTVGGSVTKVWNDNNNQAGIRPASVTVQLLKNGENYLDPVVLNAVNNWTASATNLPAYENGQLITYTVVETPVPEGYTASYAYADGVFTVTNTHIPDEPILGSITISKIISDRPDDMTPFSVTVTGPGFNQSGSISQNENGDWVIPGLTLGTYTITENASQGYTTVGAATVNVTLTEANPDQSAQFTNALLPDIQFGQITVTKQVVGADPDDTVFEITINNVFKFFLKDGESDSILVPLGTYNVVETPVDGYQNISITPANFTLTTAGQTVVVVNEKIESELGSITIRKTVVDLPDEDTEFEVLVIGPNNYQNTVMIKQGTSTILSGLELGTYTLTELAKEGFVTVGDLNLVVVLTEQNPDQTRGFTNAIEELDIQDEEIPGGELPQTSGVHPSNYFGLGSLVAIIGILFLFIQKKKEETAY